ncbi:endonuclease/exonuclease/phosphatase family protein [Streptomyces sp. NPDC006430]|uniref:endonuclease/exonuclease/phosphatase family protein n=1 Tax=Streptomyces sp. NPDC006430 TaxID=3154299 RepID=UPI0033B68374
MDSWTRTPRKRSAAVITAVCAAVGALLGVTGYVLTNDPAPKASPSHLQASAAPSRITVIDWNICGEAGGQRGARGYCPNRNRPDLTVSEIRAMVDERKADVITLQEVCGGAPGSHLALLEEALDDSWTVRRARGTRPDGAADCRGSLTGELGIAIAVRGKVTAEASSNTLSDEEPQSGEQVSPVLCVDVEGWSYRVCTTHLLPSSDKRGSAQAERIVRRAAPDGKPYILTGDFNRDSKSPELAPFTTALTECKQLTRSGQFTHHAWDPKISDHVYRTLDHVFASAGEDGAPPKFANCGVDRTRMDTTPNTEGTVPNGKSDHAPVYATISLRR